MRKRQPKARYWCYCCGLWSTAGRCWFCGWKTALHHWPMREAKCDCGADSQVGTMRKLIGPRTPAGYRAEFRCVVHDVGPGLCVVCGEEELFLLEAPGHGIEQGHCAACFRTKVPQVELYGPWAKMSAPSLGA